MSDDFASVRDEIRELEQRVLAVHTRMTGMPEMQPLAAIATRLRTFADMLPVYGAFVSFMEEVFPATETANKA